MKKNWMYQNILILRYNLNWYPLCFVKLYDLAIFRLLKLSPNKMNDGKIVVFILICRFRF